MTIMPIYKICPVCKKKYIWNPDVGRSVCSECRKKRRDKGIQLLTKLVKGI